MIVPGILSKKKRRIGVVLNIAALFLTVFLFELIRFDMGIGKIAGIVLMGLSLVTVILSFIIVFGSTGIWKMSHQRMKALDERQIQVILNATRISYSVFVIVALILIYGFALIEKGPIDVVIAASLLYLAHLLPASILAWTEKEI
jgi:predicted RND superfamily exporter protein